MKHKKELEAAKQEVARLAKLYLEMRDGHEHVVHIMHADIQSEKARVKELEAALKTLRNEVKGTLSAHELAIRYDSGNSNWVCLELALKVADKTLKGGGGEG